MIPNNTWISGQPITEYATYGLTKPKYKSSEPFALVLGPKNLSESNNKLNERYWLVTYEQGRIVMRGAE